MRGGRHPHVVKQAVDTKTVVQQIGSRVDPVQAQTAPPCVQCPWATWLKSVRRL